MVAFPPGRTEALIERGRCAPPSGVRVRHILLVTRSFPPLNLVSSLRMYQWAKYWSRDGVRVTVLTTKKHWFSGPRDLDWPALPHVKVVEVEFLPAPLLRLLERRRPGRAVGSPSGHGRPQAESTRVVGVKTWLRRLRLSSRLLPAFEFYDLWVAKAVRAGAGIMATDPADVIVSSFGPPAAHKIGARLKRRFPEARWVADYRDPWTFHENFVGRGLTGYLERRREHRSVGRGADLLACVSNRLAEQARRFTDKPVIVIENGFDPEEQAGLRQTEEPVPEPLQAAWGPVTLAYTGTLHLDYQDPTPLLRALRLFGEERAASLACLKVLFFGTRQAGLARLIEREGVGDRVRIMGYVDRPTALFAQRHAAALLLFENQASAARGVLRAKMFEYLQAGRPILGIGFAPDTEVGRILIEGRLGRVCGADPEAIREALRRLARDGEVDGFAPEPTVLARFRRDLQAGRLLRAMEALLERAPAVTVA